MNQLPNIKRALTISYESKVSWHDLLYIIDNIERNYSTFSLKKKRGGFRLIYSPYQNLKSIQNFISKKILSCIEISSAAYGFVCGKSIMDVAKVHQFSENVLSVDLKDFFPSINEARVYNVFRNKCGYSKKVSSTLATLCCVSRNLAQGAPTSPSLSNIIASEMDGQMLTFCCSRGIKYTRYADDLAFSGSEEVLTENFFNCIKTIINSNGFLLNNKKTRYGTISKGAMITGLRVYNDRIIVPRHYIKKIEMEMHYILKFGYEEHLKHEGIISRNYLRHLKGKILFVNYVEPLKGKYLLEIFEQVAKIATTKIPNVSIAELLED